MAAYSPRPQLRLAWFIAVVAILALTHADHVEEDFAFDADPDPQVPSPAHAHGLGTRVLQRQWGIPDTTAVVGHLFRYRIPNEAFSGEVAHYEARSKNGQPLPAWLLLKRDTGAMEGVPTHKDVKEHYIRVRAVSSDGRNMAQDTFLINVISDSVSSAPTLDGVLDPHIGHHGKRRCAVDQGPTTVTILMDVRFDHLKPKQRVITIENLSGFLSLPHDIFKLEPDSSHEDLTGETVITAGEGTVKKKKWKQSTILHWQVGCDGKIWPEQSKIVDRLKHQATDGTLEEVLRWPVIGWYVKTEQSPYLMRDQAVAGSGYPDAENEDGESDINELSNQVIPSLVSRPIPVPSTSSIASSVHVDAPHHATVHHVRHHHDEDVVSSASLLEPSYPPYVPISLTIPHSQLIMMSTPVLDPVRPTLLGNARDYTLTIEPTPSLPPGYESSTLLVSSPSPEPDTSDTDDFDIDEHGVSPLPSDTSPLATEAELEAVSNSTFEPTEAPSSSTPIAPTSPRDFSNRGIQSKNAPPVKQHRLRKLNVTAGKILRERIPDKTFVDSEDGDTTKLKLELKSIEGSDLNRTYWIQLDEKKREIIALPLDDHVSKWQFLLVASDVSGETANDTLEVSVHHHRGRRTVNHEFVIVGEPDDIMRDQKVVPWEIELVEGLAKFFGDKDSSQITVLHVNLTQLSSHGPVTFAWKNDSLPRESCPEKEAQQIMKALTKDGEKPSEELLKSLGILGGHLNITKISYKGLMNCETTTMRPSTPPGDVNNPPVLRNHVDHISATIGQLLTFIVPEDTFYDDEDTSTRNMKLSLLTIDLQVISPQSWLQFDEKNQEFYGVPLPSDEGTHEYQLLCTDKGGKTVQDSLIVVVRSRPPTMDRYGVDFSMTLNTTYNAPTFNAAQKRKFINKVSELFEDKNTSSIILANITTGQGTAVVRWFNSSLPTDKCPDAEIRHLRQMILENDGSLLPRVTAVMGPEFTPASIELQPAAVCQGELTPVHVTDPPPPPVDEPTPLGVGDEYWITFVVPAVIICVMLLLASVVACMLYRRRRTGKMTLGDEDERQSYRNKGIPVIFQDELEERPEPANKSPVIMKEEKPPLPPPEYQRNNPSPPPTAALLSDTEDAGPYQPPPPFTTSRDTGRQPRHKHTPTYRKPPAYVPP